MKTLIIGMGEVGRAHYDILSTTYPVSAYDIKTGWYHWGPGYLASTDKPAVGPFDIMHIATPWLGDDFIPMVEGYAKERKPKIISVLTTVPPETCRRIEGKLGIPTVHSTTRGLHPNLVTGLLNIMKHVGGTRSKDVAAYFQAAGIRCRSHQQAVTTELAHQLINIDYAVALAFADEKARICRQFGVDYVEAVMTYTMSHNDGFTQLDHRSKCRPILTPPNGRIGGHCLVQNAKMLAPILRDAGVSAPLVEMIEKYNDPK